jgi:uncharacterized protein YcnI
MRPVLFLAASLALLPAAAAAKVTLAQTQAPAGAKFTLHFKVTDGCNGGKATDRLSVAMPRTVVNVDPQFVKGWLVSELHSPALGDTATWGSGNLGAKAQGDFPVIMVLPKKAGPLSFTATQFCGKATEKSTAVLNVRPAL